METEKYKRETVDKKHKNIQTISKTNLTLATPCQTSRSRWGRGGLKGGGGGEVNRVKMSTFYFY